MNTAQAARDERAAQVVTERQAMSHFGITAIREQDATTFWYPSPLPGLLIPIDPDAWKWSMMLGGQQ